MGHVLSCMFHMYFKRDLFTTNKSINNDSILDVNNMACDIVRIGSIKIKMYDEIVSILSNIRHIPSLKKKYFIFGHS